MTPAIGSSPWRYAIGARHYDMLADGVNVALEQLGKAVALNPERSCLSGRHPNTGVEPLPGPRVDTDCVESMILTIEVAQ